MSQTVISTRDMACHFACAGAFVSLASIVRYIDFGDTEQYPVAGEKWHECESAIRRENGQIASDFGTI